MLTREKLRAFIKDEEASTKKYFKLSEIKGKKGKKFEAIAKDKVKHANTLKSMLHEVPER